jgi:hypothetical protein
MVGFGKLYKGCNIYAPSPESLADRKAFSTKMLSMVNVWLHNFRRSFDKSL